MTVSTMTMFLSLLFKKHIFKELRGINKKRGEGKRILSPLMGSPSSQESDMDDDKEPESDRRAFTFDGEVQQINLLLQEEYLAVARELQTELLKFAACCSGSQQPQDVSRGFLVLHRLLRRLKAEYKKLGNFSPPTYLDELEKWLKKRTTLDKVKRDLIVKAFKHNCKWFCELHSRQRTLLLATKRVDSIHTAPAF